MDIIIAIVGLFGAAAVIIFLSTVAVSGVVKAVFVTLVVLFAVYSLARVSSSKPESGKEAAKERAQKFSSASRKLETTS